VKLLFDQNLSFRLVDRLRDVYPDSEHVRFVGLASADDAEVWDYAARNRMLIVSKDSDFRQRSFLFGAPPKVVSVALGNCSTAMIELAMRRHFTDLQQFEADPEATFLVIS
jgi:predicted nuclease of predicted toxin-antitoxin system